jgi:hypothetical protein
MRILAAFAQLDTDQHPFGIDVADPQHDDLAARRSFSGKENFTV